MKLMFKNLSKIKIALLSILVFSLLPIFISFGIEATFDNPLGETSDIHTLVMKILDFLIILAIPLTAILIIYAGLLYITSAGNAEKIKTAQKTLIWALIGFAIVLIAKSVPPIIEEFLSGKEESPAEVPAGAPGAPAEPAEPDSGGTSAPAEETAEPDSGGTSVETPIEEKTFVKLCSIDLGGFSKAECKLTEWKITGPKPDDECTTASECEALVYNICLVDNLCHPVIWHNTGPKPKNECELHVGLCKMSSATEGEVPVKPTETPIEETEFSEKTGKYNACRKPSPYSWAWSFGNANTLYCKEATWTGENPGDECSILNEVCQGEGTF